MRFKTLKESVDRYTFYHYGGEIHPNEGIEPKGWYFWCEDECSYSGPYSTQWKAYERSIEYSLVMLGPDPYHELSLVVHRQRLEDLGV